MKKTILYLHGNQACWTLWQGSRLLNVFSETITREAVEKIDCVEYRDAVLSDCPWLSPLSSRVRLVIDPTVDKTQSVPAFNHGLKTPNTPWQKIRWKFEYAYLTCRSLTSDVLSDDLTRYRRDQLANHPAAILHWSSANAVTFSSQPLANSSSWLLSDSGLPLYVFEWLLGLAEWGIEFVDVRSVASLFAQADSVTQQRVVTVNGESYRWRLIVSESGCLQRVEQWGTEIEAQIALDEYLIESSESSDTVRVEFIGSAMKLAIWQEKFPNADIRLRKDTLRSLVVLPSKLTKFMPESLGTLPVNALLSSESVSSLSSWKTRTFLDFGSDLRVLLSTTRWKKRYKRSIVATTMAAAFSGYFVLLAIMHASEVIELHDRAMAEKDALIERTTELQRQSLLLSVDPARAAAAVVRLDDYKSLNNAAAQEFLYQLNVALEISPAIILNSISWRRLTERAGSGPIEEIIANLDELIDLPEFYEAGLNDELFVLISGTVASDYTHEFASISMRDFLTVLSSSTNVIEVEPIAQSLASVKNMNFPADVSPPSSALSSFVFAIRVSV